MMKNVHIQGVLQARQVISRHLRPTPLINHPLLDQELGCLSFVKHESHNPTGSFKIRGGINLVSRLSEGDRQRGLITATRGNHGQSIALACRLFGVSCTIVVPYGNNPEKNRSMEAFGARLIIHGKDFDEAREKVEALQGEENLRYVHSANEPDLVHGVGTYALEILEDLPDLDVIFVPLGGGSGLAGVLTVVRCLAPSVRVIGVQAQQAPAVYLSWKEGHIVTTERADTIADGLATRVPFDLTFSIIRGLVDEIMTVTEEEILFAIGTMLRTTHGLAEGAGAAALAGALNRRDSIRGKKVVLILSGCNIETSLLRTVLNHTKRG